MNRTVGESDNLPVRGWVAALGWRRIALFVIALIVALVGTGIGLSLNGHGPVAISQALADPLAVLAGRSPGARPEGALTQTKPSRVLTGRRDRPRPFVPSQRVLTSLRYRPPVLPPIAFGAPPEFALDNPLGQGPLGLPLISIPTAFGPGLSIPPVGDGGVGGPPPTVITAVPEPTTWVMLIGGFFAIGSSLRRDGRRRRIAAAARP